MQKTSTSNEPSSKRRAGLIIPLLATLLSVQTVFAQSGRLKPGFDKAEYQELMYAHATLYDTGMVKQQKFKIPRPTKFDSIYTSPVMGLDNRWGLWKNKSSVVMINLRGTTLNAVGWLENFYAAMVPARGELQIAKDYTFKYDLASSPKAAVHIGWLVGTAYLSRDILPKVDSLYKTGVRDFLIMGHSQGGALSYLLTAHFYSLQNRAFSQKIFVSKPTPALGPRWVTRILPMNMSIRSTAAGVIM